MPASHAGDHRSEAGQGRHFLRHVVNGEEQTHLTQNQAALDVQFVSCRPISKCPQSIVSDAFARYASLSPVQFRVGAPASQSSQRSGGFHKPAVPRAALGTAIGLRRRLPPTGQPSFFGNGVWWANYGWLIRLPPSAQGGQVISRLQALMSDAAVF